MTTKVKVTLKGVFYPEPVAVIGASSGEEKERRGWTRSLLNFGYKGKLYPINPKATEILGLKAYPSITAIEGQVDYAILNVSAPLVPKILRDCAAKGVKTAHVFTTALAGSEQAWARCVEAGLAVFRSYESAARAMSNLICYYEFKEKAQCLGNQSSQESG